VRGRVIHGVGFVVVVTVTAAIVAGCGGGSSSTGASGATGAALSQQEFTSQANAICKTVNEQTKTIAAPTDLPSLADAAAKQIESINAAYAKLTALAPPSESASTYSKWLAGIKTQIGLAGQVEAAAKAGDQTKVQDVGNQLQAANKKSDAEARSIGLTECAKNVQPQG
jgi:hypothetical protein